MPAILSTLVVATLLLFAVTTPAIAKPPRTQTGPEAYFNASPITQGRVERYLINPNGEIDGLLLDSGSVVRFPPHLSEQLVAAVRPGEVVAVQGYAESASTLKAFVITNTRSGQRVVDEPPAPSSPPPFPRDLRGVALKPLTAQGQVRVVLTGRRGEINGIVLQDGTTIRFPPHVAFQFTPLLKVGEKLGATGYGTENEFGRALEATAIGPSSGALQTLYDVGPHGIAVPPPPPPAPASEAADAPRPR